MDKSDSSKSDVRLGRVWFALPVLGPGEEAWRPVVLAVVRSQSPRELCTLFSEIDDRWSPEASVFPERLEVAGSTCLGGGSEIMA